MVKRNFQLQVPSPDKGGGLASGAARLNTLGKSIMESSMYTVHNVNDRRSPVLSDMTCPRPNMPTSEGLPQKWRLRTKKLAKMKVRFKTVNIGTMTGKSR